MKERIQISAFQTVDISLTHLGEKESVILKTAGKITSEVRPSAALTSWWCEPDVISEHYRRQREKVALRISQGTLPRCVDTSGVHMHIRTWSALLKCQRALRFQAAAPVGPRQTLILPHHHLRTPEQGYLLGIGVKGQNKAERTRQIPVTASKRRMMGHNLVQPGTRVSVPMTNCSPHSATRAARGMKWNCSTFNPRRFAFPCGLAFYTALK